MVFEDNYKALKTSKYSNNEYSIVPIRYEDRYSIMKWRNEQIYHLRQSEPLTTEDQDRYFKEVIFDIFQKEKPNQILFSFLKNGNCIGYGGLVHINWIDMNAEISFIMNTELEEDNFSKYWLTFLSLIEDVAFNDLKFNKIFTYALDLRPHLYDIIEKAGFIKEAILKEHCFFNGEFKNVIIHAKFNSKNKT